MKRKAIILDRDGVVNVERGEYTWKEEDFVFTEGLGVGLQSFKEKGYLFIIISNQSGISKKLYSKETVLKLHQKTIQYLAGYGVQISDLFFCPHHPEFSGNCLCRKPGSLMYEKAAAKFNLDIENSYVIGDKDRDIQPALKLGFNVIKVESNTSWKKIVSLID